MWAQGGRLVMGRTASLWQGPTEEGTSWNTEKRCLSEKDKPAHRKIVTKQGYS